MVTPQDFINKLTLGVKGLTKMTEIPHRKNHSLSITTHYHHPSLSCLEVALWILACGIVSCNHQDIHLERKLVQYCLNHSL